MFYLKQFLMRRRQFLIQSALAAAALPAEASLQSHESGDKASSQIWTPPMLTLPRPKFWFEEEVVAPCQDEHGFWHSDRGIIIGMVHNPDPSNYFVPGWWYQLKWSYMPSLPSKVGKNNDALLPENGLKPWVKVNK